MNDTRFDYTFGQLHKSPSKLNGINIKEQKRQNFIIHIIYWQRIFCIIYLLLYSISLQEIGGNVSPQLPSSMQYLSSYYPPQDLALISVYTTLLGSSLAAIPHSVLTSMYSVSVKCFKRSFLYALNEFKLSISGFTYVSFSFPFSLIRPCCAHAASIVLNASVSITTSFAEKNAQHCLPLEVILHIIPAHLSF